MLKAKPFANALAITMVVVYVICALAVAVLPNLFRAVAISWFHGIDFEAIWTGEPRGNFFLGLISTVVFSWFIGYFLAWVYNRFTK